MKPVSIWDYIWVGTCLRYLQDVSEETPIRESGYVSDNIAWFFKELSNLNLHVTQRASSKLEDLRNEYAEKPQDAKLTAADAQSLKKVMNEIRLTFEAETQGIYAYFVTDKRFDVKKLLENVDRLFSPGVYKLCPLTAQYDFKEAGRSIAFGLPTGAAFHILRGTEDVLRLYYKKFVRPAKKGLTWGQIINELRNKVKGKRPDNVLLNNLDNLRNSFRNPTQHPEKIYDIYEVQDLFSLCIDVTNRMITTK